MLKRIVQNESRYPEIFARPDSRRRAIGVRDDNRFPKS
jgi:hypothetical protein